MSAGLKAGLNVATLYGDDIEESDARIGLCLGGFTSLDLTKNFALQGEVLYTQKGAYDEEYVPFPGGILETTIKVDYLELPLLAKLLFPTGGGLVPSVYLGPAVAFEMGSSFEFELGGIKVEGDLTDVKDVDIGLVLGTGLGFGPGPIGFLLDFRYTAGLVSIDDTPGENQVDLKNSVATLSLGVSIQP
jgi:hypothetical protein